MNRRFSTLIQYLPAGAVIIALAGYILWDNVRELTRSRRSDAE